MESRIDPDFNAREADIERVVLRVMAAYPGAYKSYNEGNGLFVKWMLGITSLLLVSGIGANIAMGWSLGNRLTAVEVQLAFILKNTHAITP